MKNHRIIGGGGIQLNLSETGKPNGRPILFIHGFSQCGLAWNRQLTSELTEDCRLVAMDIRGHGRSDKPREGYSESKLWADDIHAAIQALGLDHPLLCGWSYGPLAILDYIRHYGDADVAGLVFVGGITKLGTPEAGSAIAPEFLNLVPGFFSQDVEESVQSLQGLLRLCFAREVSTEDSCLMLGYNVSVPPYVRQALLSRVVDNDDVLPRITRPVLIVHGANDAVIKPAVVDEHKARIPHAHIELMANVGHAAFWDDATRFNRLVRAFAAGLKTDAKRAAS
jgi:non-heme chloroperoxidase